LACAATTASSAFRASAKTLAFYVSHRQRYLHSRCIGRLCQRSAIQLGSMPRESHAHLEVGEIHGGLRVIGIVLERGLVLFARRLIHALAIENDAEAQMRDGARIVHLERFDQRSLSFVGSSQIGERNAEIGERFGIGRIGGNGCAKRDFRQIEAARLGVALSAPHQHTRRHHFRRQCIGRGIGDHRLDAADVVTRDVFLGLRAIAHALIGDGERLTQLGRARPQLERFLEMLDRLLVIAFGHRDLAKPGFGGGAPILVRHRLFEQPLRLIEIAMLQIHLASEISAGRSAPLIASAASKARIASGWRAESLYRCPSRYGQRISRGVSFRAFSYAASAAFSRSWAW
jgi:hypothetical protein